MSDWDFVKGCLRPLAALHKAAHGRRDYDQCGTIESIACMIADRYGYPYDNMNLHLASMWPVISPWR